MREKIGKVTFDTRDGFGSVPDQNDIEYFGFAVIMDPHHFLKLLPPLGSAETGVLDADYTAKMLESIEKGKPVGPAFLSVDFHEKVPTIKGHEGRHRALCLQTFGKRHGGQKMLVTVFPSGGMRARNLTVGMIQKMRDLLVPQHGSSWGKRARPGPHFDKLIYFDHRWLDLENLPEAPVDTTMALPVLAKRMGSALRIDELPPEWAKRKPLARGTTSIIFDDTPDTVIIFTKDSMKREWLRDQDLLIEEKHIIDSRKPHPLYDLRDRSIYVLKMQRLYPLSKANVRKMQQLVDWFEDMQRKHSWRNGNSRRAREEFIRELYNYVHEHDLDPHGEPTHFFAELARFLMNYSTDQYQFDLHKGNFMQTRNGDLVLIDPVIDPELFNVIREAKDMRRAAKENLFGHGNQYRSYYRRIAALKQNFRGRALAVTARAKRVRK